MEQLIREAEHTINPPWWFVVGGIQSDDCCASSKVKGSNLARASIKACALNCPIAQEPMAEGEFVTLK